MVGTPAGNFGRLVGSVTPGQSGMGLKEGKLVGRAVGKPMQDGSSQAGTLGRLVGRGGRLVGIEMQDGIGKRPPNGEDGVAVWRG